MLGLLVFVILVVILGVWIWNRPDPVTRDQNNQQSDLWLEQIDAQLNHAASLVESASEAGYERAYQIYTELANKYELPEAYVNMAEMHLRGTGRSVNVETAIAMLEKAFRHGSDDAAYRLGCIYDDDSFSIHNPEKAIYWFQYAIAKGNQEAQFHMADKYFAGDGVAADQDKAMSILQDNAEQGHANSLYALGMHYCAEGAEQDLIRGHDYLHQAAENGHLDANLLLVEHYLQGIGVPQNQHLAMHYIQASMALGSTQYASSYYLLVLRGLGDPTAQQQVVRTLEQQAMAQEPRAQSLLGTAYFHGWAVAKDQRKAFEYWSLAANAQDVTALCSIASLYFEGILVDKDPQKAFSLYQHAQTLAEHNFCVQMGLAMCYLFGEGTAQNMDQAKKLLCTVAPQIHLPIPVSQADFYRVLGMYYSSDVVPVQNGMRTLQFLQHAAQAHSVEAMCHLGECYLHGFGGLQQDEKQAFYWYQQGANLQHAASMCQVGVFYLMGMATPVDYEKALYWNQQATALNDSTAMNNLAEMYLRGWGVEKDLKKAVSLYQQAADLQEPEACYQLGRLYLQGEGVVRNMDEARHWLNKARLLGFEKADQLYQRLDEYF